MEWIDVILAILAILLLAAAWMAFLQGPGYAAAATGAVLTCLAAVLLFIVQARSSSTTDPTPIPTPTPPWPRTRTKTRTPTTEFRGVEEVVEVRYWTACVDPATGAITTCVVDKEDAEYYPVPTL